MLLCVYILWRSITYIISGPREKNRVNISQLSIQGQRVLWIPMIDSLSVCFITCDGPAYISEFKYTYVWHLKKNMLIKAFMLCVCHLFDKLYRRSRILCKKWICLILHYIWKSPIVIWVFIDIAAFKKKKMLKKKMKLALYSLIGSETWKELHEYPTICAIWQKGLIRMK